MFTKEDDPTINNEDTAEFKIRKNAQFTQLCNF